MLFLKKLHDKLPRPEADKLNDGDPCISVEEASLMIFILHDGDEAMGCDDPGEMF
jgi:hypothetical protein